MKNIGFINGVLPADGREVRLLEARLGGELPEQFKEWLLLHDGGIPRSTNDSIDKDKLPDCPSGVYVAEFFSLKRMFEIFETYGIRIPHGMIPIAQDGAGNLICLSIFGELREAVYFWDHEQEPTAYKLIGENIPHGHINTFLIAPKFNEFLEMLGPTD